jgi:hypothetical protein
MLRSSGFRTKSIALALALALVTLMSILLLFSSHNASAQTVPKADYRFQDTRSSSVGTAPALIDIGTGTNTFTTATVDGTSRKVLSFPQGNGLKLSPTTGVVFNGTYTIVAQFEFDSVDDYRRIIDFKNGTSDNGLYASDGNLEFFRSEPATGIGAPIAPNTYVEVTLTRNSSGTVAGYVNGELQFSFSDASANDAVIDANNALRFFRDNESGGVTTEHSAGSVARIRLYDVALPTTFTVNSTGDQNDLDWPNGSFDQSEDGRCDVSSTAGNQCTLRAAIQLSNVTSGAKTIAFDIPGTGLQTITPGSALPPIFGSTVTIDGYSQPGASANTLAVGNNAVLRIELNGANAGATAAGIRLASSDNVVKGMIINRWGMNGVEVTNRSGNSIEGNYIGTDASGNQNTQGNGKYGVWLHGASNNVVGGTTPAARNVISGNGKQGIYISRTTSPLADASGNRIEGNYVGTDKNGSVALGNGNFGFQTGDGVWIDGASNNVVGGTVAGARNVISGNKGTGVVIGSGVHEASADPSDNTIEGNYIGTDASGTQDLGNGGGGVIITHNQGDQFGIVAGNNVVGGTTSAARNVISGNDFAGVTISFSGQRNNQVMGNYIGTDASGTLDRGNRNGGVFILGSLNNVVGGTTAGAGNLISGNDGPGVFLETPGGGSAPTGNRILRNSIFDNDKGPNNDREIGIDLEGGTENPQGVTRNDTGDGDTGPNRLQNHPVITSAITSGGQTTIEGTINTTANDRLTLQFFSSPAADPSGFGEGETYIGQITNVDTDPEGNKAFSFITSTPLAAGQVVTATATSTFTNDTSEFSAAVPVEGSTPPPPPTGMPFVKSTNPTSNAPGVDRDANISAKFSEGMLASTINTQTVYLKEAGGSSATVPAEIKYNKRKKKATLNPDSRLEANTQYTATIEGAGDTDGLAVEDKASNAMATDHTWSFTTGAN